VSAQGTASIPEYVEHKRRLMLRLMWPNGAALVYFSAEDPDFLRGGNFELCLIDELSSMKRQDLALGQDARYGMTFRLCVTLPRLDQGCRSR